MEDSTGEKGITRSPEHRAAISRALKGVPKSPEHRTAMSAAKGLPWEQKGYSARHQWVRTHWIAPSACEDCGATGSLEWASIGHTYTQERVDWKSLCRACHLKLDQLPTGGKKATRPLLWEPKD